MQRDAAVLQRAWEREETDGREWEKVDKEALLHILSAGHYISWPKLGMSLFIQGEDCKYILWILIVISFLHSIYFSLKILSVFPTYFNHTNINICNIINITKINNINFFFSLNVLLNMNCIKIYDSHEVTTAVISVA